MPKNKPHIKDLLIEIIEKILQMIMSSIEEANPIEWVADLFHLKQKIRKFMFSSILLFVGVIIMFSGLSAYLVYLFPALKNGIGGMLIGFVLVVISMIVYKAA